MERKDYCFAIVSSKKIASYVLNCSSIICSSRIFATIFLAQFLRSTRSKEITITERCSNLTLERRRLKRYEGVASKNSSSLVKGEI